MQQIHKEQQEQMEKKMNEMKKEIESKKSGFLNNPKLMKLVKMFKNTLVVFLLIIFFNVNSIDEFLRFKKCCFYFTIFKMRNQLFYLDFQSDFNCFYLLYDNVITQIIHYYFLFFCTLINCYF